MQPPAFQRYTHKDPLKLHLGGTLPEFDIAYETWGRMNEYKDNVILLTTGLSASSHAKSHDGNRTDGWWEKFVGPGLALDTNKYHIICTNVIGGCFGSTGPSSIDPISSAQTGNPVRYANQFPMVTIWDMVRAQFRLLDHLGISKLHAVVGSSMGGMQSLAAAALFPTRVGKVASVSACARSHPCSIALRHVQRQAVLRDPAWKEGHYYPGKGPEEGLMMARRIGTITYRSGPEWEIRFGRKRADARASRGFTPDYQIETYLEHQGRKWRNAYDANSFLYISRAMDMFDMKDREAVVSELGDATDEKLESEETLMNYAHTQHLVSGMRTIQCPTLVVGVKSDFLIPSWQQLEVADCLRAAGNASVTYVEIDGVFGHDTFLVDVDNVGEAIRAHLDGHQAHGKESTNLVGLRLKETPAFNHWREPGQLEIRNPFLTA
ncbi:Alpha/Beta hydrolase protein [Chytriomyces sp. MP71]|nr:Alpha/Beta hydrolase protein [Chytriomyces sp. MP71]